MADERPIYSNGIEARVARQEQRVTDIAKRVDDMVPVVNSVGVAVEQLKGLRRDLDSYKSTFQAYLEDREEREREDKHDRDERERQSKQERRAARRAQWSLTVTILVGLLGAAAVLIASAHP